MKFKWIVYCFALLVFVHALISLSKISTTLAPDFSVFYEAARGLITQKNIYTLPMYTGFGYPPFTLLPFIPLLIFPYKVAQVIWVVLSFTLFLYAISLSGQVIGKKATLLAYCLIFSFAFLAFPTKFTLGMGQVNIVALTFFLGSILANQKKLTVKSGILLGLTLIIKPHLFLFMPIYLLAKKWKQVGIASLIVLLGVCITGVFFGWGLYEFYFRVTVPPLMAFAGRELYYNQSLGSFFSRLLPISTAALFTSAISLILVITAYWVMWKRKMSLATSVLFFTPIFLLVEPLSWQHHYVFLLPVFVYLFDRHKKDSVRLGILVISFLLIAANIKYPEIVTGFPLSELLRSHVFIGNVLLLGLSL